ncbi:hypothetical protein Q8G42_05780 [Acinetobacter lwoffii]|jgi:hypothetical protein|uniref:Helicase n=1 Tax=Acinetobacter lwoffii TaxID=28090 RepID=A0AAW8AUA8_ACILW|nr:MULTISPECIES: hypothetical protein [Pseudomonadota]ODN54698.1 hypothetical protein A9Z54_06975 [Acinetobacter sp. 51m]EEY90219.1 hypothetical protein HMPREF0017_01145 [Acinetobacter lwoffii SH145]ENU63020.1 hypothetical protein F980_01108 [Acinetobacter lwoffii NIPH 715]ENX29276.1 hypothetical protein F890_02384 [Acinetobacter sp. CIP 64.7]MDP1370253.1 hypothetical protein [Acinetobacter lwoffii]
MDLQTQVEKKLCEDEHLYFTRRFFKPRMGFKFTVNWHHVYISWIIDQVIAGEIANVVINVPPGAGKTELTTNLIPRGLALNARSRFLYLSFSQSLVAPHLHYGATILPKNGQYITFAVGGQYRKVKQSILPPRTQLGINAEDEAMVLDIVGSFIDEHLLRGT